MHGVPAQGNRIKQPVQTRQPQPLKAHSFKASTASPVHHAERVARHDERFNRRSKAEQTAVFSWLASMRMQEPGQ